MDAVSSFIVRVGLDFRGQVLTTGTAGETVQIVMILGGLGHSNHGDEGDKTATAGKSINKNTATQGSTEKYIKFSASTYLLY